MAKYLGETGLVYLWGKIKSWVGNYVNITSSTGKDTITAGSNSIDIYDWAQASTKPSYTASDVGAVPTTTTVNGHALSSNVTVTASDIGVESGAEVNQNAFSNVKVGNSTIAADGKTDTLELAVANNSVASLTADTTNDKVTIDVDKDLSKYDNSTSGFITSSDIPAGVQPYTSNPAMDGTASAGSSDNFSRGDHVHPTDTSRAASDHVHGNITNDGKITATGVALANNDTLVIVDSSDSSKIKQTSIKFDGSTDTKALTQKGTWETFNNYSHPTTTAVTAAAVKVGNDGLGHVVIGAALAKGDVGLGNVTNDAQVKRTEMGVANGVATLDSNGLIPSSQLPSYVDDVIEAYIRSGQTALSSTWLATGSASGTVITPEAGKIYVLMNSDSTYEANTEFRWGGSAYVKINDGGLSEMTTSEMDTATDNWT